MANSRLLESHEFGRLPISNAMPFAESSPSEPQHLVLGALLLSSMTQMSLVEPFWGCNQQWGTFTTAEEECNKRRSHRKYIASRHLTPPRRKPIVLLYANPDGVEFLDNPG
jgi:hypothetical protein